MNRSNPQHIHAIPPLPFDPEDDRVCPTCDGPMPPRSGKRGRPSTYCDDACKPRKPTTVAGRQEATKREQDRKRDRLPDPDPWLPILVGGDLVYPKDERQEDDDGNQDNEAGDNGGKKVQKIHDYLKLHTPNYNRTPPNVRPKGKDQRTVRRCKFCRYGVFRGKPEGRVWLCDPLGVSHETCRGDLLGPPVDVPYEAPVEVWAENFYRPPALMDEFVMDKWHASKHGRTRRHHDRLDPHSRRHDGWCRHHDAGLCDHPDVTPGLWVGVSGYEKEEDEEDDPYEPDDHEPDESRG